MRCALFVPMISRNTHVRDEGYFRLEWKLAVDRSHLMVADRPFLVPVVIDDTSDQDEKVACVNDRQTFATGRFSTPSVNTRQSQGKVACRKAGAVIGTAVSARSMS